MQKIVLILDESGSMQSISETTISSVNEFVESQKKESGDATFTLIKFNDESKMVYNDIPLKDVPLLTESKYQPDGTTALNDAIGYAIKKFRDAREVIMVILTDGLENSSTTYTRKQIFDMINEKKNWKFIYLGANQDSFQEGSTMGIKKTCDFVYSNAGVRDVLRSASQSVSRYRSSA